MSFLVVLLRCLLLNFCLILCVSDKIVSTINFGSCHFPNDEKNVFEQVIKRNPDLWIWLGDSAYLDHEDIDFESNLIFSRTFIKNFEPSSPQEFEKIFNITKV